MSGLFEDLSWRGLVHQVTDTETLPKLLDSDSLVAYIGFDPTADSLHVGHLHAGLPAAPPPAGRAHAHRPASAAAPA